MWVFNFENKKITSQMCVKKEGRNIQLNWGYWQILSWQCRELVPTFQAMSLNSVWYRDKTAGYAPSQFSQLYSHLFFQLCTTIHYLILLCKHRNNFYESINQNQTDKLITENHSIFCFVLLYNNNDIYIIYTYKHKFVFIHYFFVTHIVKMRYILYYISSNYLSLIKYY